ncbi:MAG: hypothetical protein NT062_20345, partial [Proteobacteria bacterium]|nr:hypothetical protein [Pseudomonadota bacterium]
MRILVAGPASVELGVQIGELRGRAAVALGAVDLGVRAGERVLGLGVIERGGRGGRVPAAGVVAALAVGAERRLVGVGVARDARGAEPEVRARSLLDRQRARDPARQERGLVAVAACDLGVATVEREPRELGVLEVIAPAGPAHEIAADAAMIGVALAAVVARRRVQPGARGDPLAERDVAIEAPRHGHDVAAGVTADALVEALERRVIARERARGLRVRDAERARQHEPDDDRDAGHIPNPNEITMLTWSDALISMITTRFRWMPRHHAAARPSVSTRSIRAIDRPIRAAARP